MSLLQIAQLNRYFGGLHVTRDVSLSLQAGERVALIGPNGAGKTTFVNLISGVLKPNSGHVQLAGTDITAMSQPQRVRQGLVRTFQITTLPMHMPIGRQVEMALHQRNGHSARMWGSVDAMPATRAEAAAVLQSLDLVPLAGRTPAEVSYGQQRLVEIALALALKPRVLILDEPMAGVPKGDGRNILECVNRLPSDLAVLIIEHDMDLVFSFASRIVVMAEGAILATGSPAEIRTNALVRKVYLGNKA